MDWRADDDISDAARHAAAAATTSCVFAFAVRDRYPCYAPFRSVPCVLLPALPDRMAKCVDRVARPLGCLIARVQNIEPL